MALSANYPAGYFFNRRDNNYRFGVLGLSRPRGGTAVSLAVSGAAVWGHTEGPHCRRWVKPRHACVVQQCSLCDAISTSARGRRQTTSPAA